MIAIENRPELTARRWELAMQRTRVQQEQTRPFFPTVSVGFSGGVFGGGSDLTMPFFGRFNGRSDIDVVAYWSAQNLGVGNVALARNRRALADQAWSKRIRTLNLIRSQVADGFAAGLKPTRELVVDGNDRRLPNGAMKKTCTASGGGRGFPSNCSTVCNGWCGHGSGWSRWRRVTTKRSSNCSWRSASPRPWRCRPPRPSADRGQRLKNSKKRSDQPSDDSESVALLTGGGVGYCMDSQPHE